MVLKSILKNTLQKYLFDGTEIERWEKDSRSTTSPFVKVSPLLKVGTGGLTLRSLHMVVHAYPGAPLPGASVKFLNTFSRCQTNLKAPLVSVVLEVPGTRSNPHKWDQKEEGIWKCKVLLSNMVATSYIWQL